MNNKTGKLNIGLFDRYTAEMTPRNQRQFFANENGDPLHAAFDRKATVHPGMGGQPIAPKGITEIWTCAMAMTGERGKRAAYFHIPFCSSRCPYCGFYLNAVKDSDEMNRYIDYIIRELAMVSDAPFINSHPFHAVYLGGGTPTALSATNLLRLLEAIQDCLPLANDCEITVEGRIHGFSNDKVSACIEGGVNRFSIGIQSFNTFVRRKMGRINTEEEIKKRLEYIRDLDQAVMVIDLIYGLPYQTMKIWEDDIETYLELGLDGVDLYQLNIFKGSPLETMVKEKVIPKPADIGMQADMFARGVEVMKGARYQRLSKSHWRRTTRERNIYNSMLNLPGGICVPFGSGAGGWLKDYFFFQDNNLESYYQRIDEGNKPIAMCLKQPVHSDLFKEIVRQMELGYCHIKELGEQHGFHLEEIFAPILEQWERVGLVKIDGGRLELTLAGEFWQENLSQNLIDYFTEVIGKPPASHSKVNTRGGH